MTPPITMSMTPVVTSDRIGTRFTFFTNFRLFTQFLTSNMANMEQQMRQMFIHLGFSQAVATSIVNDHGIVTLTNLLCFEPSDIDALCKNIQRPGGTIAGRNNQQVPNPGMPISTMAQSNLKLATFWIMHRLERVQRPTAPPDVTVLRSTPSRGSRRPKTPMRHQLSPPRLMKRTGQRPWKLWRNGCA